MVSPAAFGFAHIRLCTFGNRWARGLSEQYRSIVNPVMALAARFVAGVLSGVASRTTRGFRPLSPQTQLGIRMFKNLLATKPIAPAGHVDAGEPFEGSLAGEVTLKRTLTGTQLILLGIGAVIGAGLFVLTGQAEAEYAGDRKGTRMNSRH